MGTLPSTDRIDRRSYLSTLAAAGGASLAGCLGDGDNPEDGSDSDHGERVPELVYEFSTGLGNWSQVEEVSAEIFSANIEEALGVSVEARPKEASTLLTEMSTDARVANLYAGGFSPEPLGLDPSYYLELYHIQQAGAEPGLNQPNYHSCEYSKLVEDQFFAATQEEREELVHEAMAVFSEDIAEINTFPIVGYGALDTDQVVLDEELLGSMGLASDNYDFLIRAESTDGEPIVVNIPPGALNTNVHTQIGGEVWHNVWSILVYSPLMRYNSDEEVVPDLAESYEITDDSSTFTFELHDTTFHNGDPVAAEDVKFTLELYETSYVGLPGINWPYESIELIDERTVEINFPESMPTWLTSTPPTSLGILPKDIWEEHGAPESLPEMTLDEIVGSGPYEVETWRQEQILSLSPNEDHYQAPSQGLVLEGYADVQSANRAFEGGELSVMFNPSGSMVEEFSGVDHIYTEKNEAFTIAGISPQFTHGPTMFREFRLAISQCLNRMEANAAAVHGDSTPHLHSAPLAPTHEWYPDDHEGLTQIAPDPEGDRDQARQTLEDAAWTWDDNGNLRYPSEVDLTPPFPEGSSPMEHPEDFPCVEEIPEHFPS